MNYKKFLGAASAALMIVTVSFILVPGAWAGSKYKVLYKFSGADGANPQASLIFDQAGNLYGTTQNGGSVRGTVFELTPNQDGSWTESGLYGFNWSDGAVPEADLIFDAAGNLYSTTFWGGANPDCNCGTVFELTPGANGAWTETVLHDFEDDNGNSPSAGLIWDAAGTLYGATLVSGISSGNGIVFELTPKQDGSWTESVLHRFKGGSDGDGPDLGNLVFDAAGDLYGATVAGGGKGSCTFLWWTGCGTIFELSPNTDGSWKEKVLHRFSGGKDGAAPKNALTFDNSGNLYGTAVDGGAHGYGNVFELTPNADGSWKERVLHQFTGNDGANPNAGLIFDATGNLYGTAFAGGEDGNGVVFEITP